jgi:hypothetical protein
LLAELSSSIRMTHAEPKDGSGDRLRMATPGPFNPVPEPCTVSAPVHNPPLSKRTAHGGVGHSATSDRRDAGGVTPRLVQFAGGSGKWKMLCHREATSRSGEVSRGRGRLPKL